MTHAYGPIPTIDRGSATAKVATDDVRGEIYGHPLAPLWRRYGSMLTDMGALAMPLILFSPSGAGFHQALFRLDEPFTPSQQSASGMLGFVVMALALNIANARTGQTPGKQLFGTALAYPMLDDKGQLWLCRAPLGAHVRRTLAHTFSFLGWGLLYLLPLKTRRRQTLGDKWAGTVHINWYFAADAIKQLEMPAEQAEFWERHDYRLVRRGKQWTEAV